MSSHPDEGIRSAGPVDVTPRLLRQWALPAPADSKYGRGQVLVVGGAARTPGAALLAGLAVLRVGAGRLTLAVAESAAVPLAVAVPESGVVGLPQTAKGSVRGGDLSALADGLEAFDVVLVGPGLDDHDEAMALLRTLAPMLGERTRVVLDAYALGVLPEVPDVAKALAGRLVLTPNEEEGAPARARRLRRPWTRRRRCGHRGPVRRDGELPQGGRRPGRHPVADQQRSRGAGDLGQWRRPRRRHRRAPGPRCNGGPGDVLGDASARRRR